MKIDLHVHSKFSRRPSEWILKKIECPESFTEPLHLYNIARERGMTHVTITDHNCIEGALSIGHLPGTFISEEVTTYFPENNCKLHVLVYNINEAQHRDIQRVRENVYELVPYLQRENIFHILAHPLYPVNGKLTPDHVEKMMLLFKNFEMNGARNHRENQQIVEILNTLTPGTIRRLQKKHRIDPLCEAPYEKKIFGGSDDHSSLNIARTYTELEDAAITDFSPDRMAGLQSRIHIRQATPQTMAHNIYSIAWQFYRRKFNLEHYAGKDPLVRFLDRSLLSVSTDDHRILSRIYFFFSRNKRKKKASLLPDSLSEHLKHEISTLVKENPDLLNQSGPEDMSPAQRDQRWFELVNQLARRLTIHFSDHLLGHVAGVNVFNIFQTIGSAGGLYALLAPYFIAYTQFTLGRDLGHELKNRFQSKAAIRQHDGNQIDSLHVAHFTDTFYEINGVALTLNQQVKLARKKGKHYTLITCDTSEQPSQEGVTHFNPIGTYALPEYPEQKLYYPPFLDMLQYCHEEGFTHIHTATPGPIGLAALAIAKILKLPISGTYHTQIPQYAKVLTESDLIEEMTWKYILWYYDQLDVIYAPSESTRQELTQKGVEPGKIKLYPRGIDINQFQPARRNGFFHKHFDADKYVKFLYVGRVSREKNLDLLVEAFRMLTVKSQKKAFLCVVGNGPYLEEMKSEMQGLPCLFTGYLEGDSLADVYASSDVFVFPSTTDTFGNVVLEAQASGLPVIVTDQGGPHENMIEGKTGKIIPGECVDSLFESMLFFSQNPDFVHKMKAKARIYSESRSFEEAFNQTWQIFADVDKLAATA